LKFFKNPNFSNQGIKVKAFWPELGKKQWLITILGIGILTIAVFAACADKKAVNVAEDPILDAPQDFNQGLPGQGANKPNTTGLPVITELQDSGQSFVKDLQDGKYTFAVDEKTFELKPLDGETIPPEEQGLYQKFLEESAKVPPEMVCSALPDYWRYACWREICYALSAYMYNLGQYGQSRRDYTWQGRIWLAGDWDYDGLGYGRGGQCKYFASRIVTRATGERYSLPSGYNYATGDIGWCRPGDIIQKATSLTHTAIVFEIRSRDGSGRATSIDVIDANFVNYPNEMIARHYLPYGSYTLDKFKVW
jgi:hypothetical protein